MGVAEFLLLTIILTVLFAFVIIAIIAYKEKSENDLWAFGFFALIGMILSKISEVVLLPTTFLYQFNEYFSIVVFISGIIFFYKLWGKYQQKLSSTDNPSHSFQVLYNLPKVVQTILFIIIVLPFVIVMLVPFHNENITVRLQGNITSGNECIECYTDLSYDNVDKAFEGCTIYTAKGKVNLDEGFEIKNINSPEKFPCKFTAGNYDSYDYTAVLTKKIDEDSTPKYDRDNSGEYFFTPNSDCFHKENCSYIKNSAIKYNANYRECILYNLYPCERCLRGELN